MRVGNWKICEDFGYICHGTCVHMMHCSAVFGGWLLLGISNDVELSMYLLEELKLPHTKYFLS
jgi:hypothetical protein